MACVLLRSFTGRQTGLVLVRREGICVNTLSTMAVFSAAPSKDSLRLLCARETTKTLQTIVDVVPQNNNNNNEEKQQRIDHGPPARRLQPPFGARPGNDGEPAQYSGEESTSKKARVPMRFFDRESPWCQRRRLKANLAFLPVLFVLCCDSSIPFSNCFNLSTIIACLQDENATPTDEQRPRSGSLSSGPKEPTETMKQIHMPQKISF